ncbi:MAG: hypothetical protein GC159_08385 [Phycisphaera sp.]|nr:hypothetical protein [Phycisphaera sp.]
MSLTNKSPSVQTYRLMLYQRPLHPELFGIQDRRAVVQPEYEVECWMIPGGHILRFQGGGECLTEVVVDQGPQLPQRGLLQALPCLGEKELEDTVNDSVRYISSVQTELLSDNLYAATLAEMKEFSLHRGAMRYEWVDAEGSNNLSVFGIERYKKEVHTESYHLIGAAGFVLRTQSIFEIL